MSRVLNISAYKFAPLDEGALPALKSELLRTCRERDLRGTILLSPEGVNGFLAGDQTGISEVVAMIREIPGFESFEPKESWSEDQPFNRMLVKIKREIIAFGIEGINPGQTSSPKLPPAELKRWLDEGRRVHLLDTRNDYEIKMGTFAGAIPAGVQHFRDFPAAVGNLPEELRDEPTVMFCTGGIRCEKAGPYMARAGFKQVFQLDGGILKYFEECGGAHWNGECFVFDRRVGLNPELKETGSALCFNCQMPLTTEELQDSRYVYEKSCPYCYSDPSTPCLDSPES